MPGTSAGTRSRDRLRRRAASAIAHGRYRRALDLLGSAGPQRRNDARLNLLRGRALARLFLSEKALASARRALTLDGSLLAARQLIADLHLGHGRIASARSEFERVRRTGGRAMRVQAAGGLACCAAEERCFDTAERVIAEAIDLRPNDPVLWCDRGDVARLADRPRQAVSAYRKALALQPRGIWARLGLARLDYEAGRFGRAAQALKEAIRANPEEVAAHLLAGDVALARGQLAEGARSYEAAFAISPRGDHAAEALAWAAEAHYRAGQIRPAVRTLQQLVRRFPSGIPARDAKRFLRALSRADGKHQPRQGRIELTGFPRIRQYWDYCGPAALAMVLRYWKLPADQRKIGRDIWERGTPLYRMSGYLRKRGLFTVTFRGDVPTVRALVDRGVPVIVDVQSSPYGHFRIVIGYDRLRGTLILQDPGMIEPVEQSCAEFVTEWAHEGHWSVVAVPRQRGNRLAGIVLPGRCEVEALERCRRLVDRKRYCEARQVFAQRLKGVKPEPAADRFRVTLALEQGRLTEARRLASVAARRYPTASWPWLLQAETRRARGDLGRSAVCLRAALRRSPRDYWSHLAAGQVALDRGWWAQSSRHLRQAVRLDPESAAPHAALGTLHVRQDKLRRALESFRRARELAPDWSQAWSDEGYVLDKLGDLAQAERCLRRALSLAPKEPWVLNELAYLLARRGRRLAEGVRLARRALRRGYRPTSDVYDTIGWLLYLQGRTAASLPLLIRAEKSARSRAAAARRSRANGSRQRAAEEDEALHEVRLHLGEVLLASGNAARGRRVLNGVADSRSHFAVAARTVLEWAAAGNARRQSKRR